MIGRAEVAASLFAADAAGQLDVLGHDGDALGVDSAQVRVLKEADEVGLGRLLLGRFRKGLGLGDVRHIRANLEGAHSCGLEAQVCLDILCNLAHQALKRQLADQQLRALLVAADLAESDGAWTVAVRLLNASGYWSALASGLGGQLLAGRLAAGGLAGSLLGARHSTVWVFSREMSVLWTFESLVRVGLRIEAGAQDASTSSELWMGP